MNRSILLTAIAAASFATPALATDAAVKNFDTRAATVKGSVDTFSVQQARNHLVKQGYVNISELARDSRGAWSGTAEKNGKKLIVAVGANSTTTGQ